jgi:hypothetical protein
MGANIFQTPTSYLKILGVSWATWRNFRTEFPQIWRHRTEFRGLEDLAPGICAPLWLGVQTVLFRGPSVIKFMCAFFIFNNCSWNKIVI